MSKPMKYALESVPELIGENEFQTLVSALGLSQSFTELLDPHPEAVGAWFARTVSRMAKANEVRRRRGGEDNYVSSSDLLEASR